MLLAQQADEMDGEIGGENLLGKIGHVFGITFNELRIGYAVSTMPLVNPERLPTNSDELLALIEETERSRRFVWTTARIIQELGLNAQLRQVTSAERKYILLQLKKLLEELCSKELLRRRVHRQSVRLDNAVGFDFVGKRERFE